MELRERYPYWLAGEPRQPNEDLEVVDKYTGEVAARVAWADAAALDEALAAAHAARADMAALPPYERKRVLLHCVRRFRERAEELALALCIEAGKPIRDARGEVARLVDTFEAAAEEAVRQHGEVLELQVSARAAGYRGYLRRFPVGVCGFVTPFNFPLNLVAHKVAPAIAAGCPFVLKPASATPVGALVVAEILAEAGLPRGAFSVLPMRASTAQALAEDDRVALLSFTGSPAVGWDLKARAVRKKVVLELGGNAAVVVCEDWRDLEEAADRIVLGAYYQSGQSCISVQRILVHADVYERFRDLLVERVRALRAGDPKDPATFVGPVVTEADAARIEEWIAEAVDGGARLLAGGGRRGRIVEATLLEDVPHTARAWCREVFGPVAAIERFERYEDALDTVNDSVYGLQAGVFTRDHYRIQQAWEALEVGGVIAGDIPSWRVDPMPYGGVKMSGVGREGIRWSIEDMTEPRLLVVRTPPGERGR